MNNKKGSAIAEAAIVFPVVIVVVVTVLYILITLYTSASYTARDHLAVRACAGAKTETVERANGFAYIMPEDRYGRKPFTEDVDITEGARFPDKLVFTDRGRAYVTDEVDYIRKIDLLKGVSE